MKNWIILLFGIACISISAIFVKLADVTGLVSAFYRVVFAFMVVAPFYLISKKHDEDIRSKMVCVIGGICFGLELAFWNVSVMISTATIPTLLVNLSIVWVAIGATFFLKERTTVTHWIGTGFAIIGVVIVFGINQILEMKIEEGEIFAIIGSLFLAAYTLIVKHARTKMRTNTVLFYSLIGSFIPLLIICLAKNIPLNGYAGKTWFYLVCIGVITQVGGYSSINYALGHISSIKVSLLTLLQPVITGILASLIIGEVIQSQKIAGGLIVLFGLAFSFVRGKSKQI